MTSFRHNMHPGRCNPYIYIWIQNCNNVQQNTPKEVHMGLMANLLFKQCCYTLLGFLVISKIYHAKSY